MKKIIFSAIATLLIANSANAFFFDTPKKEQVKQNDFSFFEFRSDEEENKQLAKLNCNINVLSEFAINAKGAEFMNTLLTKSILHQKFFGVIENYNLSPDAQISAHVCRPKGDKYTFVFRIALKNSKTKKTDELKNVKSSFNSSFEYNRSFTDEEMQSVQLAKPFRTVLMYDQSNESAALFETIIRRDLKILDSFDGLGRSIDKDVGVYISDFLMPSKIKQKQDK